MDREEPAERTSVTLPAALAARLTYEARRSRRSASAVVRDALTRYFADDTPAELPPFVGIGASGHSDTSARVDETVGEVLDEEFEGIMGRDERS
jgi:metal-responsive CopG/Arc/MetJ family transcriptional regulator